MVTGCYVVTAVGHPYADPLLLPDTVTLRLGLHFDTLYGYTPYGCCWTRTTVTTIPLDGYITHYLPGSLPDYLCSFILTWTIRLLPHPQPGPFVGGTLPGYTRCCLHTFTWTRFTLICWLLLMALIQLNLGYIAHTDPIYDCCSPLPIPCQTVPGYVVIILTLLFGYYGWCYYLDYGCGLRSFSTQLLDRTLRRAIITLLDLGIGPGCGLAVVPLNTWIGFIVFVDVVTLWYHYCYYLPCCYCYLFLLQFITLLVHCIRLLFDTLLDDTFGLNIVVGGPQFVVIYIIGFIVTFSYCVIGCRLLQPLDWLLLDLDVGIVTLLFSIDYWTLDSIGRIPWLWIFIVITQLDIIPTHWYGLVIYHCYTFLHWPMTHLMITWTWFIVRLHCYLHYITFYCIDCCGYWPLVVCCWDWNPVIPRWPLFILTLDWTLLFRLLVWRWLLTPVLCCCAVGRLRYWHLRRIPGLPVMQPGHLDDYILTLIYRYYGPVGWLLVVIVILTRTTLPFPRLFIAGYRLPAPLLPCWFPLDLTTTMPHLQPRHYLYSCRTIWPVVVIAVPHRLLHTDPIVTLLHVVPLDVRFPHYLWFWLYPHYGPPPVRCAGRYCYIVTVTLFPYVVRLLLRGCYPTLRSTGCYGPLPSVHLRLIVAWLRYGHGYPRLRWYDCVVAVGYPAPVVPFIAVATFGPAGYILPTDVIVVMHCPWLLTTQFPIRDLLLRTLDEHALHTLAPPFAPRCCCGWHCPFSLRPHCYVLPNLPFC